MPNPTQNFIDNVKGCGYRVVPTDTQVSNAVTDYLNKNPVQSVTATIENGVLKLSNK